MNVAYIGHRYHEKTKSTQFLCEFLRRHSRKFDLFADYSLVGGPGVELGPIVEAGYDLIVVFQMELVAEWFAKRVPDRLVFIPMYDGARYLEQQFWAPFQNSRVLSFSHTLHELLQRLGVPSLKVQYFPDPSIYARAAFSDFHGFFWQRQREVPWALIKRLAAGTKFASFTLNLAPDPGCGEPFVPDPEDMRALNITLSHWYEDRSEFDKLMADCNVHFASRRYEGIGMSFLEAMARGQCVVAPDTPTMSEYMTHGISGMLYDADDPCTLDLSDAAEIGAAARRNIARGFPHWQKDQDELLPEFFFGGRENAYDLLKRVRATLDRQGTSEIGVSGPVMRSEGALRPKRNGDDRPKEPRVTVAMVMRNAYRTFIPTLESILSQTYRDLEVIVVDGASRDGTRSLIQDWDDAIDHWVSEPDRGPYDGMNKAARLARGRYILFMNAGDLFASKWALADAMEGITNEPDFIIGHHVYVWLDGTEEFRKVNDFDDTWRKMREGTDFSKWMRGVPCHQATLTRTELLRQNAYDLSYRIAADHEFMYRMRSKGASFHHCDATLAIYFRGGISSQHEALCRKEWRLLASAFGYERRIDLWQLLQREFAPAVSKVFRTIAQGIRKSVG